MIKIMSATTEDAVEYVVKLAHEYVTWLVVAIQKHYPKLDISELTAEHDYDDLRKKFPGDHIPPYGFLLIAEHGGAVCGCIALGKLSDDICEMRTLFVRPEFRGQGVGKKLVEALLTQARELGYRYVRLDTLGFMQSALTMYRSLGFYNIAPYRNISAALQQYVCFLELDLSQYR
jgi:ribosomal protein S18 acetylase RimI-like enzyme